MASKQAVLARMRATRAAAKADMLEAGVAIGTGVALGKMSTTGALDRIPDVFGLPKTVIVAIVGKAVAYNTSGKARQVANGVATGSAVVAGFQFGAGQTVMGVSMSGRSPRSLATEDRIAARLTESIRGKLEEMQDDLAGVAAE